jgi:hypothetical protein
MRHCLRRASIAARLLGTTGTSVPNSGRFSIINKRGFNPAGFVGAFNALSRSEMMHLGFATTERARQKLCVKRGIRRR